MNNSEPTILLVGPSFVGKTTFFNNFVNKQTIRNHFYPGTKIQVNSGYTRIGNTKYRVIDTPGIYNLIPTSENEVVTLSLILEQRPDKIIFITTEENMEHNLLIMIQLAEIGIPFIVNFYRKNDFIISPHEYNNNRIASLFNTTVVRTTPVLSKGIYTIRKKLQNLGRPRWVGSYNKDVEELMIDFDKKFRSQLPSGGIISSRFILLMLLLANQPMMDWFRKNCKESSWEEILSFINKNKNLGYSFNIANRWKALAESLHTEIITTTEPYKPNYFILLDKYTLSFFWDIIIIAAVFLVWYILMSFVGSHLLVNLFYNGIFGKYLAPAFVYLSNLFFKDSLINGLLVGQYGLLTVGFSYAFAIILPSLIVFFFIYSLLDEMGLITRMSVTLNRFFHFFGMNGYALPHIIFGTSCKIAAYLKTRTLETEKEQFMATLALLFTIPCISQFAVISNLLSIIPQQYVAIYFLIMFIQLVLLIKAFSFISKKPRSNFVVQITPLKIPNFSMVFEKTNMYVFWYVKEIIPLLLLSTFILFFCNELSLLPKLQSFLNPLVSQFLDLPDKFTETIILGLFRKDFGAVSLYDLANNGLLNSIQVLVAVVFLSLSVPCLGFIASIYKEKGPKTALLMILLSTLYAFFVAFILNKVLRF